MRARVRERACLAGLAVLALTLTAGAPIGSATQARTAENPRIFCGIEHGPTWTAGGHTGNTWYVAGLSTRSECKNSANWATILGKRIIGHDGATVQAFNSGPYGCVLDRGSLEAACYLGNGGPGATGVIVIGNPTRNSLIPAAIRLHLPLPLHLRLPHTPAANPADDQQAGVPIPSLGGRTCTGSTALDGPEWAFLLPDGTLVTGTRWTVESFEFFTDADCSAIRDLWPTIAHSIDRHGVPPVPSATSVANGRSWAWQQGSWGCISARDFSVAPSSSAAAHGDIAPGDHTVGLPFAGCARSTFPGGARYADGTPSLSPALEQVVVYPNTEVGTSGIPSAQIRGLNTRVIALRNSLDYYGISVVALGAITSQKLSQAPPTGGVIAPPSAPSAQRATEACGGNYRGYWPATDVPSAPWTGGGATGSTWTLATAGGYPCELADPIFKVFLANLTSSSATLGQAQLHRYGWACTPNRADLMTICRFAPELYVDQLSTGVGHPVPNSFRIGVAAPLPNTSIQRVGTALDASA